MAKGLRYLQIHYSKFGVPSISSPSKKNQILVQYICGVYLTVQVGTRKYVTTSYHNKYIVKNQVYVLCSNNDPTRLLIILFYNTPRRCRSRDTSSASSNWNATATSNDGKAILWNLNTGGEYEIMVSCQDEMAGESMFSRSILTSQSKGKRYG